MIIQENIQLAPLTWMKIGGPARYFVEAHTKEEVVEALQWAEEKKLPVAILGGGSNTLIADAGFQGLVIRFVSDDIEVQKTTIRASAGYNLNRLALVAEEHALTGFEFALGIPGTVGGAIRGNAGAFGGEMKDVVSHVLLRTTEGVVKQRDIQEGDFGYRHSCFKENGDILLEAIFQLQKGERKKMREQYRKNLEQRKKSQPLKEPTLGSTFKNIPIRAFDEELEKRYHFSTVAKNGYVAAGYCIDRLELKGFCVGGARVSEQHANFIQNTGNATAEHVMMLIGIIQQKARVAYKGLRLEPEIQFLGFGYS